MRKLLDVSFANVTAACGAVEVMSVQGMFLQRASISIGLPGRHGIEFNNCGFGNVTRNRSIGYCYDKK